MPNTASTAPPAVVDARAVTGTAVTGIVDGRALAVGSPRYAAEAGAADPDLDTAVARLEGQGKTAVVLLERSRALGVLALRDEPRPDAHEAIAVLGRLGLTSVMLTGDNARTGGAIAADLGLEVRAELLPTDKLATIRELQRVRPVAMVGGTDVALETADVALLRHTVGGVAEMVRLACATLRTIYWNIGLALGLKAVILVTTLLGLTNLWVAVLSDTGATALVTLNALRLLGFGRAAPPENAVRGE